MKSNKVRAVIAGSLVMLTCITVPAQACTVQGMACQDYAKLENESLYYDAFYQRSSTNGYEMYQGAQQLGFRYFSPYQKPNPSTTYPSAYPYKASEYRQAIVLPLPFEMIPPKKETAPALPEKPVKPAAQYVIQPGDTLYRISKFFNTNVEMLMMENRLDDPHTLQVGQHLSIPAPDEDIQTWLGDGSSSIGKVMTATLTAYTAGFESTGKTPSHPAYGITSSGAKVKENHTIAVDPDVIPMGSLVYIEGVGIRKAEDTGSAIKGARIDVYIPDLKTALKFGVKKNVKVYVLKPKSNPVTIASSKP